MADKIESIIGGKFVFDTNNLKRGITEANQLIRILDQELKTSKAGMNNWGDSIASVTDQLDILKTKLRIQQQELKAMRDAYSKVGKVTDAELLRMRENIAKAESATARTSKSINILTSRLGELKKNAEEVNRTNELLARGLSIVRGVAINLATDIARKLVFSVKEGIRYALEFESAFKGVEKTVDASDYTLQKLRGTLISLTKDIPKSASELAKIAEIGGQLGIKAKDLGKFAEVMARLGDSTNITAENASLLIAQIGKQTNLDPSQFDRFSSALVDLGNHYATTESAILDMTSRLSAQGAIIGLTNQEILALSTVLAQTGLEAEAGGTAIQRLFKRFELATTTGKDLQKFAKIAGVSEGAFKDIFGKNALEALTMFIKGLKTLDENGTSVATSLSGLGITEVRLTDTIQRLVLNVDEIEPAIARANSAWDDNTALIVESNKKYDTIAASVEKAKNAFDTFFTNLIDFSSPAIRGTIDVATDFISTLNGLFSGNGKMGAAEFEKYMQSLRGGFSATGGLPDVEESIQIAGLEHGIDSWTSLSKQLKDAKKEAKDLLETLNDYNRQLAGPEKGNQAYILQRETEQAKFNKAKANVEDLNQEMRDFAVAFIQAVTPTNEVMDRLTKEAPELAVLINSIIEDYTKAVAAEREAEEDVKDKVEAEEKLFTYTSKREEIEGKIAGLEYDILTATRNQARAKDPKEIEAYAGLIEDLNRDLVAANKELASLDEDNTKTKEKQLDIDSYIAKYGTEEEQRLLRVKKLEDERLKLQNEMNKLSKDDVVQLGKYQSAIAGINREINSNLLPSIGPLNVGSPSKVKDPTSYFSAETRKGYRKHELESARDMFQGLSENPTGLAMFEGKTYSTQVFKDAVAGINEELSKMGEVDTSNWQDSLKKFISDWSEAINTVNDIFDRGFDLVTSYYENEAKEAEDALERFNETEEEQKKALDERLHSGEISYEDYYTQLSNLETENAAEKNKLNAELEEKKKKAFEAQKANDIAQAISSGAQAVTNALTVKPTWLGITLGTTVGLLAAAQVAQIAKQKYTPAYAHGGMPEKGQLFLANEDGDEAVTSYKGNPVVMPLVKHTEWMDSVAEGLARRLSIIQKGNTVNNNSNKDYNIVQNIYAKPATRREIYLATRRAVEV